MIKKFLSHLISLVLLVFLFNNSFVAAKVIKPLNVGVVTGTVTLISGEGMDSVLEEIYTGRGLEVKETKTIIVSGNYESGASVLVEEKAPKGKEIEGNYRFTLPVVADVLNILGTIKKASIENQNMNITFANNITGSNESVINVTDTLLVTKVTATRKGKQALVTGNFIKQDTGAKGRFSLRFGL